MRALLGPRPYHFVVALTVIHKSISTSTSVMPKGSNTSRRSAAAGAAPAPPPVATRTRGRDSARATTPDPREQAASAAAANPPGAGGVSTGAGQPPTGGHHPGPGPGSPLSSVSYEPDNGFDHAAAADAAASLARTGERLADFGSSEQEPSDRQAGAASQFAARGIRMLGTSQGPPASGPASGSGQATSSQRQVRGELSRRRVNRRGNRSAVHSMMCTPCLASSRRRGPSGRLPRLSVCA